jgi:two-component system cell cycle sensor histidine kinase/response regulator CckA
MRFWPLTTSRRRWPWRLFVAATSHVCALVLTHAIWPLLQHTPFLLGFVAVILSSRVGGRQAGGLAVIIGALGYALFPPPLPEGGFGRLLFGFVLVSGAFSWFVARRYEVEGALRSSEARLREAQEVAQVGNWQWDVAEDELWWSDQLYRIFGVEPASFQLSYAEFLQLVHPEDRARVEGTVRSAFRERRPYEVEHRIVRPGGDVRVIHGHGRVVLDERGQVVRTRGVAQDITERKRLEDQLRQSQKMEAIGMLAGGIAHDFNNLLTAIGGYTEMVLDTLPEGDTRREDLLEVAKATHRAAALTRRLLAVSRRQILQPTVLDVNGMVAEVQRLLRHTIPENIDFQLALGPVDPVRADRGQLEQVVLNLAINAGDAMPQGGSLRLATTTVDVDEASAHRLDPMPPGRYVRLTVRDTGVGMSPETKARIFEPFFTTKERGKGTGLGLATVYGIVKQSEGFIWVESEVGRGTTFDIYLPVVREPVALSVQPAPAMEVTGGTQTILLAEDDGAVRRLARDVLTNQGYTVLAARDGDEALDIARQYRGVIDLLIADVVMPGLSGRDLSERLKLERPDVRVLYISGYTENLMMRAGFEKGLTLLAKPFLPADLLRKVNEVVGIRGSEDP